MQGRLSTSLLLPIKTRLKDTHGHKKIISTNQQLYANIVLVRNPTTSANHSYELPLPIHKDTIGFRIQSLREKKFFNKNLIGQTTACLNIWKHILLQYIPVYFAQEPNVNEIEAVHSVTRPIHDNVECKVGEKIQMWHNVMLLWHRHWQRCSVIVRNRGKNPEINFHQHE